MIFLSSLLFLFHVLKKNFFLKISFTRDIFTHFRLPTSLTLLRKERKRGRREKKEKEREKRNLETHIFRGEDAKKENNFVLSLLAVSLFLLSLSKNPRKKRERESRNRERERERKLSRTRLT